MANVPDAALKTMLGHMPPTLRRQVVDSLQGNIEFEIYCKSKTCKNRLLGYILDTKKFRPVTEKDGKMYCRAIRYRLDGAIGFQCWCGNDSRLSEQEKGVGGIENNAVTSNDLNEVYARLQKKPANYPTSKGIQLVDGFAIKEVK